MEAVTSVGDGGRPGGLTYADLDALSSRDDGFRYELLDGTILVTPAPSRRHQVAVAGLLTYLTAAIPANLRVLCAPLDVRLAVDSVVQPDALVVDREEFDDESSPVRPLLAVEILSPSTRGVDQLLKRERYRQARIPAYWIVDHEAPSALVLELDGDDYREVGIATADAPLTVTSPAPLTIRPADWMA